MWEQCSSSNNEQVEFTHTHTQTQTRRYQTDVVATTTIRERSPLPLQVALLLAAVMVVMWYIYLFRAQWVRLNTARFTSLCVCVQLSLYEMRDGIKERKVAYVACGAGRCTLLQVLSRTPELLLHLLLLLLFTIVAHIRVVYSLGWFCPASPEVCTGPHHMTQHAATVWALQLAAKERLI